MCARTHPVFKRMLGIVWKNSISDDVWIRIQAVAPPSCSVEAHTTTAAWVDNGTSSWRLLCLIWQKLCFIVPMACMEDSNLLYTPSFETVSRSSL